MTKGHGPRLPSESRRAALDPEALRIAEQVIEDAWQELVKRGSPAANCRGKRVVCELMAQRVFSQASHGELDPDRLKQVALWGIL
jgi:hypothetical protein